MESISSEDEDYESAPPDYQISTFPADFTLEVLHNKWKSNEIQIPDFQRGFVWKQVQASKLIESFLVGLPVPAVFLYAERKSQNYFVIDGQQRLKSVFYFLEGYFGEPQGDKRRVFRLTGLSDKSKFNEQTFDDLEDSDKRRLKNSVLRSFIIQQLDPQDDTSMYHVFERLNTGGTLLTNQEVRNCVYDGTFIRFLHELNAHSSWRKILGKSQPDSRQKDIELMVRFFAMRDISNYEKPMKDFLSKYMKKNRNPADDILKRAREVFQGTCDSVVQHLGEKPFHVRAGLNAAVYDSVMTAFARHVGKIPTGVANKYIELKTDKDYDQATRQHTTDKEKIDMRLKKAEEILFH